MHNEEGGGGSMDNERKGRRGVHPNFCYPLLTRVLHVTITLALLLCETAGPSVVKFLQGGFGNPQLQCIADIH